MTQEERAKIERYLEKLSRTPEEIEIANRDWGKYGLGEATP
jgi:hypothetical protein